jgi:uncharacterized protein YndB with AHSA1/START domain
MPDSLHEIPVQASARAVFDAWTTSEGLSSWWTKDSKAQNKVGDVNVFTFDGGNVEFHFRIDEQLPGQRVRWTGVKADKMPDEWVGTRIEVDLSEEDGGTRLRFGHKGWRDAEGMYCVCNTTWGELMYRLRDYCEGKGRGPLFPG